MVGAVTETTFTFSIIFVILVTTKNLSKARKTEKHSWAIQTNSTLIDPNRWINPPPSLLNSCAFLDLLVFTYYWSGGIFWASAPLYVPIKFYNIRLERYTSSKPSKWTIALSPIKWICEENYPAFSLTIATVIRLKKPRKIKIPGFGCWSMILQLKCRACKLLMLLN